MADWQLGALRIRAVSPKLFILLSAAQLIPVKTPVFHYFAMTNARKLAFTTLLAIHRGSFADVALHNNLKHCGLSQIDRALVTELVYGCIRRQRSLDSLISQLANKAQKQSLELRLALHLGLYQLRYLNQIPAAAAVHTTVELCKECALSYAARFVNALLRKYLREQTQRSEVLELPEDPLDRLGILHSYPRWILELWHNQLASLALSEPSPPQDLERETIADLEKLCRWFNAAPHVDLRVNPLRSSLPAVQALLAAADLEAQPIPGLPQALRLGKTLGAIPQLPGFAEGFWMVQESSAQWVSHWLDPQPGETIADACAAPGGKTLHLAELMQNQGTLLAADRTAARLKKLQENIDRLGITCIEVHQGDSRHQPQWNDRCDRVLVDAPCSGLGTLHRHADGRWTQTPETVNGLVQIQGELLRSAASWVKPGGVLVYATCTLNPAENEIQIQSFLADRPQWHIDRPSLSTPIALLETTETTPGWVKVWPHHTEMDGFFIVRLRKEA